MVQVLRDRSVCVGAASQVPSVVSFPISLRWAPGVSVPPSSLYCDRLIHLASVQSACYPFWIEYSSLPAAWPFSLPLWAVSSWPQERRSRAVLAGPSPALTLSCLQRPSHAQPLTKPCNCIKRWVDIPPPGAYTLSTGTVALHHLLHLPASRKSLINVCRTNILCSNHTPNILSQN